VLSSEAQSRHGRIITRMGTTDMDTDTDHIPITHHLPAATSGTVTPGYPPAKSKHAEVVDPRVSTKAESAASLAARCYFRTSFGSLVILLATPPPGREQKLYLARRRIPLRKFYIKSSRWI
jgi:hypothetical protein